MPVVSNRYGIGAPSQSPTYRAPSPFPTPPVLGGAANPGGTGLDANDLKQQMQTAGTYGGGAKGGGGKATGSVTGGAGSSKKKGSSSGTASTVGSGPDINVKLNTQAPQQLQQSYADTINFRDDILRNADRAAQQGMGAIMGNAYGTGRAMMDEATQRLGTSGVGAREYIDSVNKGQQAAAGYDAQMQNMARQQLQGLLGLQGELGKTFTGWASDLNNKALQLAGLQSDNYFKNWGLGLQERFGEREADRSDALANWKMAMDPYQMQLQYASMLGGLSGSLFG